MNQTGNKENLVNFWKEALLSPLTEAWKWESKRNAWTNLGTWEYKKSVLHFSIKPREVTRPQGPSREMADIM